MKTSPPVRVTINERRAYFESRYGQLHVRTAFPSTGGFDERTPLLCLHEAARSSSTFVAFARAMAPERSVYAPDIPGHGLSDGPGASTPLSGYVHAIEDLLDGLRLRSVDVVGYGLGAAIAAELAIARGAGIRRLALFSIADDGDTAPLFTPPTEDGSHLAMAWRRERARRGNESIAAFASGFAELLGSGDRVDAVARALVSWDAAERLARVEQPVLSCTVRSARPALMPPRGRALDGSDYEADLFQTRSADVAARVAEFLDRD
jgi:pimeloyl-ACP methyl ester carboxylesterase